MLTLKQRKQLWSEHGGSYSAVARAAGISKNHVRLVFLGERRSEPVEAAIAQVLGVPPSVAFPPLPKRTRAPRARARGPEPSTPKAA
jgi:lambda repressor-like predicted transcriptional regulator